MVLHQKKFYKNRKDSSRQKTDEGSSWRRSFSDADAGHVDDSADTHVPCRPKIRKLRMADCPWSKFKSYGILVHPALGNKPRIPAGDRNELRSKKYRTGKGIHQSIHDFCDNFCPGVLYSDHVFSSKNAFHLHHRRKNHHDGLSHAKTPFFNLHNIRNHDSFHNIFPSRKGRKQSRNTYFVPLSDSVRAATFHTSRSWTWSKRIVPSLGHYRPYNIGDLRHPCDRSFKKDSERSGDNGNRIKSAKNKKAFGVALYKNRDS